MGDESRRVWPIRRRGDGLPATTPADDLPADPFPTEPPPPEPEPVRMDAPPRLTLAAVRLAALGLALVLTIGITMVRLFVGGPPSVEELRAQAGVDNWSTIAIGVKDDQPGTAEGRKDGTWAGFDIDIAYMIAADLGFRRSEVRFYAMESEDRARMQATDVDGHRVPVQMVVASFSITPEREARDNVTFSQPYLFTEQSVLTLHAHEKVSALEEFKGKNVCSLTTATSLSAPEKAGAKVHQRNRIGECIADLRARRVDAVTTDAAILAGYKARFPQEFDHWDLGLDTTEAWGVNVGQNAALKTLVDLTLYRSYKDPQDNRWEIAYANNLQSEVPANRGTPIAQAEQPAVTKPDVREQPWERVFP
ncbi:transporter substrate-binding domain-containing protein [Actinoplanes sp. NPDC049265]|uniref:transporter substrate-binding domain-containing protein n=1 Tax=Actinoplanes sp. NPDC049265 TaxID=3363902 RepID=UPI003721029E